MTFKLQFKQLSTEQYQLSANWLSPSRDTIVCSHGLVVRGLEFV